jgi:hypothetical protein
MSVPDDSVDVVILTTSEYAALKAEDWPTMNWYHQNVFKEDTLLCEAIAKHGFRCKRVGWDDPTFPWSSVKAVIIRTIWDHFHRYPEFREWFNRMIDLEIPFWNTSAEIAWNMDKRYLEDLSENGARIVKTTFLEKGVLAKEGKTMSEVVEEHLSWEEYVVKPCISGCARETYLIKRGQCPANVNEIYAKLNVEEAFMVQPYQHRIVEGEVSIVVVDGQVSHAVLKTPAQGDFRVQDDFGGKLRNYELDAEQKLFALTCVGAIREFVPLMCRVDIVRDNDGQWALSELELIDPELWFREKPEAADIVASGFVRRFNELQHPPAAVEQQSKPDV